MKLKRISALFVTVLMLLTVVTVPVFAVDNEAKIVGGTEYPTFEAAISAAATGDTVVLLTNAVVEARVDIDKAVTIDLNGKTVSVDKDTVFVKGNADNLYGSGVIGVKYGGDLTIEDSVGNGAVVSENATVYAAVSVTVKNDEQGTKANAKLTVNGGTLKGYYYGVVGNGTRHGTDVVINDGTVTGINGSGIYNPQNGSVTINGGVVSGSETGIEIRAGKLTVNGGKIISTASAFSAENNGSGTTIIGAAVAVSQHSTNLDLDVAINDGLLKGVKAVAVLKTDGTALDKVNVFTGSGATYSGDIYTDANFAKTGTNTIGAKVTADTIINYLGLVYAAANGGSYKLGKSFEVTGCVKVGKDFTLDLAGYELTAGTAAFTTDTKDAVFAVNYGGKLTINDSVGTGKITSGNKWAVIKLTETGETQGEKANATLVVNGGTLTGLYYAVVGNGNRHGTDITINGGVLTATGDATYGSSAMYIPEDGTVVINDGVLTGDEYAVEVRAGSLIVNGGTFTATTKDATSVTFNGNGSTSVGVALSVAQHSTKLFTKVEINGGTFKGTSSVAIADPQNNNTNNVTVAINGGTFDGAVYYSAPKFTVTKAADVKLTAADGYYWNTDGQLVSGKAVAKIGTANYDTLEAAFAAAKDGDTIVLTSDVVTSNVIYVAKNVTLDLNGKKVTPNASGLANTAVSVAGKDKDALFIVNRGGKLTVNDVTGKGEINTNSVKSVYSAIKMTGYDDGETGDVAALEINAGTVIGYYYGITGNGGRHNTSIVVNGGTITATATKDNLAIYNPQDGTVTINGGVLKGYLSAIEMRAGDLVVTDGTLISTATEYSAKSNGSGTTTTGAAIAVSQHNTGKEINVNVNGGVITGAKSIAVNNVDGISPADVRVAYTDAATLNGDVYYTEDFEQNGNVINGIVEDASEISTYAQLKAAATNGGTYKLTDNIVIDNRCIYVTSDFTLDLNNFSILGRDIESGDTDCMFCVKYGAKFTINGNGVIRNEYTTYYANNRYNSISSIAGSTPNPNANKAHVAAIKLTSKTETASDYDGTNPATLVVNGGTLQGYYYAITGNGSRPGTDVTINDGVFKADCVGDNLAMYMPQDGKLTINGGTFTGENSAIEVRSGDVTINGGTFTATGTPTSVTGNGNGTTTVGSAIAIAQHTTKNDVNVTINGGTFTGASSVSVSDPETNGTSNVDVALKGGTFNGKLNYLADNFAVTKADDITLAAPANYVWNIAGELVPYTAEDVIITVEDEVKDIVDATTVKTEGLNEVKESLGLTTEQNLEYRFDTVDDESDSYVELINESDEEKSSTFVEITLYKTETGKADVAVTDTKGIVVETIFEFDMTGKANLGVKSYHDGKIIEYTNSKSGEDGTFYYDGKNVHIFTTKYSTFMFDYTTIANAVNNVYASVVLSDDISVNFIFKSEDYTQDMINDLVVKVDGVTKSIVNNNDGTWKLANAITVDPVDIDKAFNVVFSSKSTDANKAFEYSVLQYCAAAIKADASSNTATICKDLIHYASACMTAFEGSSTLTGLSASVVGSAYTGDVTATDEYSATKTGTYETSCPITIKGATLVCGSTTGFRIYFTGTCGRVKVDGKVVTPVKSGDNYYVEIDSGIAPSQLDKQHTITFDEGEGTHMNRLTVKVSPVNCMEGAASGSTANLVALAKTLYKYHSDAKNLF